MPDMVALFMPSSECTVVDTWDSLGLRATASHDFEVDDVFVPRERTFLSGAATQVAGAMYKAGSRTLLRIALIGVHLGIARASVEAVMELARQKTPTMQRSKLAESETAQSRIAQAEALRLSARAFAHETAAAIQEALETDGRLSPSLLARSQLMAAHVSRSCAEAVDITYEVAGSTGVYAGNTLERCFRDIHVATQHMGVSPNQFIAARQCRGRSNSRWRRTSGR